MRLEFNGNSIELLDRSRAVDFFELIQNNRTRLEDFFAGTVSRTKTLPETLNYCEIIQNRIDERSYFPYMIVDNSTNKFIGLLDVKNIDWDVPKAELGLFMDAHYEGKGIATTATKLIVEYLIETYKFKKLLCRASTINKGSVSVILKCGFELAGSIRNDYRTTKGVIVDLNYYGRVF